MLQRAFIAALCCLSALAGATAQEVCLIEGHILNDSLRNSAERIKKVYLTQMDEYERFTNIDSATVKKGKFKFKHRVEADAPVLLHFITGFDNGNIPVFVEAGKIQIEVPKAAYPGGSRVSGSTNNDLYTQYKEINARCFRLQSDSIKALAKAHGSQWMDSPEGNAARMRMGAAALIQADAERIEFLLGHNNSPLAPLMMQREILPMLTQAYAEQLVKTISPTLQNHPYQRAFSNAVRAMDLKVGNEVPDITIPLTDGRTASLSDYRGRYVLLDFWASWCGPCIKELPYLKQLYEETAAHRERFTIISFSLDNKEKAWKDAIKNKGIDLPEWVHGSDLLGWSSPAARMMGVTAIPKIILIDPEGKAISFSLRGEEMVRRVKQILSGDLYYLQGGK